jgi:hypothetical protein
MTNHADLENKIETLNTNLSHLGSSKDWLELIRIIRQPGWTTPAELSFAHAVVESMLAQVAALSKLKADLLDASRRVSVR